MARIVATPEFREKLETEAMYPYVVGPEKFDVLFKSDFALYGRVIKEANIKLDK